MGSAQAVRSLPSWANLFDSIYRHISSTTAGTLTDATSYNKKNGNALTSSMNSKAMASSLLCVLSLVQL